MRRILLVYGFIAGGMLAAMMLITLPFHDRIGFDTGGPVVGYTTMVLAFLMIYFGVKSYRDNVGGGKVSFWRALGGGALIAVIGSACYVATWEIAYFNVMPDFPDKYAAHTIEKAKQSGATAAELA